MTKTTSMDALREQVRERYVAAAPTATSGHGRASCCADDGSCGTSSGIEEEAIAVVEAAAA